MADAAVSRLGGSSGGGIDLEKELTCAICTEILYQPLTVLKCLHTFCGSCLKTWFVQQATNAITPRPYTCPACRKNVEDTQPNATINTLLDVYLQMNPDRVKSDEEKAELAEKYRPGENILPEAQVNHESEDEYETALLEQIRNMSLQVLAAGGRSGHIPRHGHGNSRVYGDRRHGHANTETEDSRRMAEERRLEHQASVRSLISESGDASDERLDELIRQYIEEESLSENLMLESLDVEQEDVISERIAQAIRRRQSRREQYRTSVRTSRSRSPMPPPIAEQPEQPAQSEQPAQPAASTQADQATSRPSSQQSQTRRSHARSDTGPTRAPRDIHPPLSRPRLMEAATNEGNRNRHARSSSQGREREAPSQVSSRRTPRVQSGSSTTLQPTPTGSGAAERARSSENAERPRNLSHGDRRPSDPSQRHIVDTWRNGLTVPADTHRADQSNQRRARARSNDTAVTSEDEASSTVSQTRTRAETVQDVTSPRRAQQNAPARSDNEQPRRSSTDPQAVPTTTRTDTSLSQPPRRTINHSATEPIALATEPSFQDPAVTCDRCGRQHIEYELHYHCDKCKEGQFNICLRCYRHPLGCFHWYGFGNAAASKWAHEQANNPHNDSDGSSREPPHVLTGRRYLRPGDVRPRDSSFLSSDAALYPSSDPRSRLQEGAFCDICHSLANNLYWKCGTCNEGSWGFCESCVNRGFHCTHPLLALAHESAMKRPGIGSQPTPITTRPLDEPGAPPRFVLTTYDTACDLCLRLIPPTNTRYHCTQCNAGNYDICQSCYVGLVTNGQLRAEDGANGWRRCLKGHRMEVVGFEDRERGKCRVIVRDPVGGMTLVEDHEARNNNTPSGNTSTGEQQWAWRSAHGSMRRSPRSNSPPQGSQTPYRLPPDGGIGLRLEAKWSYYPHAGVEDELMFPKGAEIREAENINGDWLWGVYAGKTGLFYGAYTRPVATGAHHQAGNWNAGTAGGRNRRGHD